MTVTRLLTILQIILNFERKNLQRRELSETQFIVASAPLPDDGYNHGRTILPQADSGGDGLGANDNQPFVRGKVIVKEQQVRCRQRDSMPGEGGFQVIQTADANPFLSGDRSGLFQTRMTL